VKLVFREIKKFQNFGGIMKKIVVLFLLAALMVLPAIAQEAEQAPPPAEAAPTAAPAAAPYRFFSFGIGVPLGYDIGREKVDAGYTLDLDINVIDSLIVGLTRTTINNESIGATPLTYTGLKVGYRFTPSLGATLSIGSIAGTPSEAAVSLGGFADLASGQAASGLVHTFKVKLEYLAEIDSFADGHILVSLGASFGL
jgi:hypothetical protein